MQQKYAHSFARYRLMQNNMKIYHNSTRILEPINFFDKWDYKPFHSEIIKGMPLLDELPDTVLMRDYDEFVDKTNLMVSARRPTRLLFGGQKVEYYICMPSTFKRNVDEIPRGHYIEVDVANNKVRLIGPNSLGNWFTYKKSIVGLGYYNRGEYFSEPDPAYEDLVKDSINYDGIEIQKKIPIEELIIGVDMYTGKIVCIPEENFNPIIGIFGIRRSGKSWTITRLLDNIYHKWKKKCIVMDDPMREMDTHCLEWKNKSFINQLSKIGETTRALPLVFLHPKTSTLKNIMCKEEVGYEIVMSFKEMIQDYENVLKGKENWEFNKTGVYFRNLLYDDYGRVRGDGLASCKDLKDIKELVEELPKKLTGVKDKIVNVMKDILNSKILDISNKRLSSYWGVEFQDGTKMKYHPWSACLATDIIPVIVTADIRHHFFYPQYMKFIMEDIFKNQTENELFIRNNSEIFMFFDEVTSVIDSKNPTVANSTFERIVRESGPARIGMVYATQDIDLVPKFVRKQSTYILAFNQDAEGANVLVNDFAALNAIKHDLKTLKTFECVAFSKISPFHLYDAEGNMESVINKPIKMMTFPPLSSHKAPKKIGG